MESSVGVGMYKKRPRNSRYGAAYVSLRCPAKGRSRFDYGLSMLAGHATSLLAAGAAVKRKKPPALERERHCKEYDSDARTLHDAGRIVKRQSGIPQKVPTGAGRR